VIEFNFNFLHIITLTQLYSGIKVDQMWKIKRRHISRFIVRDYQRNLWYDNLFRNSMRWPSLLNIVNATLIRCRCGVSAAWIITLRLITPLTFDEDDPFSLQCKSSRGKFLPVWNYVSEQYLLFVAHRNIASCRDIERDTIVFIMKAKFFASLDETSSASKFAFDEDGMQKNSKQYTIIINLNSET